MMLWMTGWKADTHPAGNECVTVCIAFTSLFGCIYCVRDDVLYVGWRVSMKNLYETFILCPYN